MFCHMFRYSISFSSSLYTLLLLLLISIRYSVFPLSDPINVLTFPQNLALSLQLH